MLCSVRSVIPTNASAAYAAANANHARVAPENNDGGGIWMVVTTQYQEARSVCEQRGDTARCRQVVRPVTLVQRGGGGVVVEARGAA